MFFKENVVEQLARKVCQAVLIHDPEDLGFKGRSLLGQYEGPHGNELGDRFPSWDQEEFVRALASVVVFDALFADHRVVDEQEKAIVFGVALFYGSGKDVKVRVGRGRSGCHGEYPTTDLQQREREEVPELGADEADLIENGGLWCVTTATIGILWAGLDGVDDARSDAALDGVHAFIVGFNARDSNSKSSKAFLDTGVTLYPRDVFFGVAAKFLGAIEAGRVDVHQIATYR